MRILALMSGSSLDGIDIGVIDINESNGNYSWGILQPATLPYPTDWIDKLRTARKLSAVQLIKLDTEYGLYNASLVTQYLSNSQLTVDAISFHGHTIFHEPHNGFTYQLGSCASLAARTNIRTIGDFRSQDISSDGQGAPLMAIVDELIFPNIPIHINLGGICNVSAANNDQFIAFDMAPCNQILNCIAREENLEFDRDGKLASKGKVDNKFLNFLTSDSFYKLSAPKSLDNNYISQHILDKISYFDITAADKSATACQFIVDEILSNISMIKSDLAIESETEVLITGGGAFHPNLHDGLTEACHKLGLIANFPSEQLINYKELLLMGLLAHLRIEGKSNVLGKYTGSDKDTIAGCIYEG